MGLSLQRKLLFSAAVTAGVLGLGELAARQVDLVLPSWGAADNPSVVMTGHPSRLWGLAPGERRNVDETATINAQGLRGTLPTGDESERIMVLGDSSFFGFGVADDETLSAGLARRLKDTAAINGAIPGYSTEQSIRLMDDVGWSLSPTLLVLANFWSDTNFEPYQDRDLLRSADLSQSGLLGQSALVRWLAPWVSRVKSPDRGRIVTWVQGSELPRADQRRVPLAEYAENLEQLIREAAARDVGVVLLTPPSPVEIVNAVQPPHQWTPYRRAQAAIARHYGLPHIDMTPVFKAAYETDEPRDLTKYFLDDLHPTATGQRIMAQLLERVLKQRGWPTDRIVPKADAPFDVDALVDDTPKSRAGRLADDRSPIQNLFPGAVSEAGPSNASASSQAGPQPWAVDLRIAGGTPPYTVTASRDGHTVASAKLPAARAFSLPIRSGGAVELSVSDAAGQQRQQTAGPGDAELSVVFSEP